MRTKITRAERALIEEWATLEDRRGELQDGKRLIESELVEARNRQSEIERKLGSMVEGRGVEERFVRLREQYAAKITRVSGGSAIKAHVEIVELEGGAA